VTKRERWIDSRADEIWFEGLYKQEDFSYLKALSQAAKEWREQQQKSRKVRLF
jgi:hypothetical protein